MAKKIRHEEHENHERWLVSYADFITLLFAFFVVMYSVSVPNEGKFRTVSESIQAALLSLVSPPASTMRFDLGDYKSSLVPTVGKKVQFVRQIQEALNKFNKEVRFHDQIAVTPTDQGVLITIAESLMFESGRADVRPESLPLLEELGEVLAHTASEEIRVLGHTDNVPIRSQQFPSNWELSSARAVMIARVLTELYHVSPERVSATGFSEFRPVADNLTPENRAKNRRVELLVVIDDADQPL